MCTVCPQSSFFRWHIVFDWFAYGPANWSSAKSHVDCVEAFPLFRCVVLYTCEFLYLTVKVCIVSKHVVLVLQMYNFFLTDHTCICIYMYIFQVYVFVTANICMSNALLWLPCDHVGSGGILTTEIDRPGCFVTAKSLGSFRKGHVSNTLMWFP